eukprot:8723188-Lingulodinium_polyedra.AAC.1
MLLTRQSNATPAPHSPAPPPLHPHSAPRCFLVAAALLPHRSSAAPMLFLRHFPAPHNTPRPSLRPR